MTMTIMLTEIYDAFKEAKVSDETARKAAEAIAAYDDRFAKIERRLAVLSWQINVAAALVALVGAPSIWLLLRIAAKVGAIG
jgi:hypothetical protein